MSARARQRGSVGDYEHARDREGAREGDDGERVRDSVR
jgi:hypothetical protein